MYLFSRRQDWIAMLISASTARELLSCMAELTAGRFRALLGRPAPRGLYLMSDGYLIAPLGPLNLGFFGMVGEAGLSATALGSGFGIPSSAAACWWVSS